MTSPVEIAESRAHELSEAPSLFMLAYSAGWNAAASGADVDAYARSLIDPTAEAGFIEGVSAWRARTATAADYMPHSAARNTRLTGGNRNA